MDLYRNVTDIDSPQPCRRLQVYLKRRYCSSFRDGTVSNSYNENGMPSIIEDITCDSNPCQKQDVGLHIQIWQITNNSTAGNCQTLLKIHSLLGDGVVRN